MAAEAIRLAPARWATLPLEPSRGYGARGDLAGKLRVSRDVLGSAGDERQRRGGHIQRIRCGAQALGQRAVGFQPTPLETVGKLLLEGDQATLNQLRL